MVKHNDESIRTLLASNDKSRLGLARTVTKAVRRALVVLFERQTADEQATDATRHSNGMGFNHADALQGSRLARVVLNGRPLASWNMARARVILHKYAGQLVSGKPEMTEGHLCIMQRLARIANEKAQPSQE